jgi:hypothetical protein
LQLPGRYGAKISARLAPCAQALQFLTLSAQDTLTEESMKTILLLFCSNVFMTFAWYGHLKYGHAWPLWKAVLVSWLIALLEYCLAVPANRFGFGQFSGFQLKVIQEAITLVVFVVFAITFLKERMAWNYALSFALLMAAVAVAFGFRPGGATG